MKRIFAASLIMAMIFIFANSYAQKKVSPIETTRLSGAAKAIAKLKYPELKWKVPEVGKEVSRDTLKNGMIVYMMENHELPMINASVMIRTGSIYDSQKDMAVAGLTGTVMRTGGTKSYSADSLNELLEYVAGSVESNIGQESGSASMSVMSKDLDTGLKILNEVLRYPVFDTAKINLEKSHIKEGIRRRNDRPGGIVSRELDHLIYGDHPYGRILEWADVKDINRQNLIDYHDKYYHPNNIMIAFSGDFNSKQLSAKLDQVFGDWPRSEIKFPPIPQVELKFIPGVFVINKDVTQSNISEAQIGIKRDNPDRYAITLMNYVLGGGSFTSRLTSRVRSDEGLAYHVGSYFDTGSRDLGLFTAVAQTKTVSTHRVLEIFQEEFKKIRAQIAAQNEFEGARDAYLNNFVFQFDSPDEVVNRLMSLEYDGYPADYYQKYLDKVRAVTIQDMQRVAQKYLNPDSMTIVVLIDTTKVVGKLSDFGKVNYITLEEPKVE
jgi:zinc protease